MIQFLLHLLSFHFSPRRSLPLAYLTLSLLILTLGSNLFWFFSFFPSSRVLGSTSDLSESQIISLTNLARTSQQLLPLQPDTRLSQAALDKAKHMLNSDNFDHYYSSDEGQVTPWQFILNSGYDYHHAGENLARHYFDSQTLLSAWLESPPHRTNILNPNFTHVGVAIVEGDFQDQKSSNLIVQMFASPVPPGFISSSPTFPPPQTQTTPLLTGPGIIPTHIFSQYPPELLALSIASSVVILGLLLFDAVYLYRINTKPNRLKGEFWHH